MKRIRATRSSDSAVLQDLQYWYDPVGNITLQKDLAHQPVYFNGSVADAQNNYVYDALYRLVQAQGRELAGDNSAPTYNDSSRSGITPVPIASTDTAKMRRYTQYYDYDVVGNFVQMRHTVTGGTGNWTRYYTTNAANNRLQQTVVGSGTPENYGYDTRGNITGGFSHLQSLTYNADNRLEKIVIDSNRTAYYQYDSSGQRVRKTVVNTSANTTDSRKYVGEWELYHKFTTSSLTTIVKRETLHISDDTGRIALIDTRTSGTGTEPVQLLRYQYSNHLQSASLELDASGAVISYEEYYPYGSTSFQSGRSSVEVSLKRYRYTGKERDEESGLYYHGARYYIPWLARWTAIDPMESKYAGMSPYNYSFNNPLVFSDPSGMGPEDPPYNYKAPSTSDNTTNVMSPVLYYNIDATDELASGFSGGKLDEVVIEGKKTSKPWYSSLGFDSDGYYRNEYSDDDFSDPGNYVKFLDNAAGSIWNFGAKLVNDIRYGTWEGTKREFSETFGYYFKKDFSQQLKDTKAQFKAAFSDIRFYENIAGALMTANASSVSRGIVTSTERVSFYTVQGVEDAARLRSSGTPWPVDPTRAHLGEGVYAWGSKMEARQYLQMKEGAGIMNQEILEFSISKRNFSRFNTKLLEYGPDAENFISKYSRIYGEGLPHNFDYIRGLTGNLGAEHYFNKSIFKQLKFKR